MKKKVYIFRNRIDVYKKSETVNKYGETTFLYAYVKSVWAQISPIRGREEIDKGENLKTVLSHKIIIRKQAIKEPTNDMYFIYMGQKYDVMYFMPHYKRSELMEFYCKLTIETEDDYNEGRS